MAREVTDGEGITWTCVQAYSGLTESDDKKAEKKEDAARVGDSDNYYVVCTPTGGAQSVRLKLNGSWAEAYSDEELVGEIKAQQLQDSES